MLPSKHLSLVTFRHREDCGKRTLTGDQHVHRLRELPTIRSGPVNDLKVDTGRVRVWLRRSTGEPAIIVQMHDFGVWEKIGAFNDRTMIVGVLLS